MSQISNQLNQYKQLDMSNLGTHNSEVSNVKMNRQVPLVGPKSSGSGLSKESNMPKNFIVAQENRIDQLNKSFDEKTLKQIGAVECTTCATRTYKDGSDDPGVSFKTATHLSPAQAESAVMSHEQEHVVNEQASAKAEGREVVSQSVQIFRDMCPECGKSYVSGGVTKTTTAGPANPYGPVNETNAEGNLLDFSL